MIFKKLEKYLKNIDGKIAIYGIGKETEKNIPEINEYVEIVGLLDGFRNNGNIYGYNIISLNKAIKIGIKAIIVIARPGSCRAIVTRIKDKCNENNIKIYDVYGNNLLEEKQSKCTLGKLKPYYKKDLMNKIEEADVISFDCFNTLITRQLFSRYDLFELLYNKLSLTEMSLKEFVNQRIKSEKSTAIGLAPNLKKIYEDCVFFSGIDFAEEEFKIDKSVIIRREELVEVLNYCINKGKEAIVVTDTYYSEKQIKSILNDNSIYGIKKIYASSEYTRGKDTGLFDIVKKDYPKKKILHIGDDYLSDYKSAIKSGINSYKIYSCEDLFYGTNFMPDVEPDMELDSKIKIGLFISNIFNNPFVFERLEKDICIQNNKTIGYSFCAPLIMDFVKWFEEKTRECNDCQIWLSARDGYLIKKIYEILYPNRKTHYVLTSRTACTNGSSELMTNLSSSIVNSIYNFQLMKFAGENGVAAYGTIMYVNFIFIAIFLGYSIGSAPIISFHYGAKNNCELKNLFKKSLSLIGSWGIMLFIIAQIISGPLAKLFVGYNAELFVMTKHGFQIFCFAFLINGFNIFGSSFFTALNNGLISAAISFLRTLVFQLSVVLILPMILGINGIWISVAIAELLTLCVTVTCLIRKRKVYHYI